MLKSIKLYNFRTFLQSEVTFSQRHLFIGANNSGKSNLCAAIRFLGASATSDLRQAAHAIPGGPEEIKSWMSKDPEVAVACNCSLEFGNELLDFRYEIRFIPAQQLAAASSGRDAPPVRITKEELTVSGGGFEQVILLSSDGRQAHMLHEEAYLESGSDRKVDVRAPIESTMLKQLYVLETNRRAIFFRQHLGTYSYFAFSPEHIRYGWSEVPTQYMYGGTGVRGDLLATAIFSLKTINERAYQKVLEHARIVEPRLGAINFYPVPDRVPIPFVDLQDPPRASWSGLSDGTLRCLALATVIEHANAWCSSPGNPTPVIVIEEPENGLYPGQLRRIFDLFEERAPAAQFIFTSHSPYFINMFDNQRDSVTILRRENGYTEIAKTPAADSSPDRYLLAEQYALELEG